MKITTFDKPTLKLLRKEISSALAPIVKQYGISLEMGTIRFSSNEFRGKLTGRTNGALASLPTINFGTPTSPAGVTSKFGLENLMKHIGLDPSRKHFTLQGTHYTIVDVKPSRPKWPVIAQGPRGGRYKFQVAQVRRGLV
jgi:hypothetical protein